MGQKLVRRNCKPHIILIASVAILGSLVGLLIFAQDAAAQKTGEITEVVKIWEAIKELNDKLEEVVVNLKVPVGTILPYGGPVERDKDGKLIGALKELEERGWLFCDGDEYSKQEYEELYHVIKTAHGGSKEMFRVPDLRGRFVRGVDHGAGRDPDVKNRKHSASGGNSGNKVGSIQEDDLANHEHKWRGWRLGGGKHR